MLVKLQPCPPYWREMMFNLSYTSPSQIEGTIQLRKRPSGLGFYTDINGKRWDIHGIIGDYVQACPVDSLHPYYTDTSGSCSYGLVQQTWKPYKMEII